MAVGTLTLAMGLLGGAGSLMSGLQATDSLFDAAESARAAGDFNSQVEAYNSTKRLNALARDVQKVLGTQGVQAASTGFRSTSKSFLAVKAAGLAELERQIVEEKSASRLRQSVAKFEAESRAASLRAQARTQRRSTFMQLGQNLSGMGNLLGGS